MDSSKLTRVQTSVTSSDKKTLNDIIFRSLELDGVPTDQIPLHSQAGMLAQAINTNFDVNIMAVENIKRESSILRCRALSSVYSQLIQHTNEIELSRPSKIDLMIKIPLHFINTYGRPITSETKEFIYHNTNEILLDNLPFVCEFEKIYIRTYGTNKDFKEVRVFLIDKHNVEVNLISQRYTDPETKVSYVLFDAPFHQVEKEFREYSFTDTQYERFVVETNRPIHSFTLTYIAPGGQKKPITPKLYFTRTTGDYLEYKYLSNKSIVIDHNYIFGGFKPELTGTLRVDLVTTYGTDIKYNSLAKISNLVPNNLPIEYLPIGKEYYESYGGRLASDNIEVMRSLVLKLKGTRKRIDTESDMRTFLLNYSGSSLFEPIMTVNNVKSRVFSVFTTLSFSEKVSSTTTRKYTIPTDSADVYVNPSSLPTHKDNLSKTFYSINSDVEIVSKQNDITSSYNINIGDEELKEGESLFKFITPFIHTYSKEDNYIRTYLDMCDNVPYRLVPSYETEKLDVESRFVASNIRVDLKKKSDSYEYIIKSQIRADNPKCNLLENSKFKAVLRFKDPNNDDQFLSVQTKSVTDIKDNNKYDLVFDCTTKREIFGDQINLSYKNEKGQSKTIYLSVKTPMYLDLYLKDRNQEDGEYLETYTKVTTFNCDNFQFFEEVTRNTKVQSTISYEGDIKLINLPMVEKTFYDKQYMNRWNVYTEIKNLIDFLNKEVYDEVDAFATRGNTLHNLQETLFDISIKFVKSVGVSKRLQVGSDAKTTLRNLQLKPKFFIRRRSKEFDTREISNILNDIFIRQDFLSSELAMWNVASDIMVNNTEFIVTLQFINFDEYEPDFHTISRKTFEINSIETPEVLSLSFNYNEELGIYEYDVSYKEI